MSEELIREQFRNATDEEKMVAFIFFNLPLPIGIRRNKKRRYILLPKNTKSEEARILLSFSFILLFSFLLFFSGFLFASILKYLT